jgi:hypothetical protein
MDGRVNESGTHEELIRRDDGIYASLWKVQTGMLEREGSNGVVEVRPEPGEV